MEKYTVLLKIDPSKSSEVKRKLHDLPEKPDPSVKLYYAFNVFGDWDACLWFEADQHDKATDFARNKIATIPGVTKTYLLKTTILKEYVKKW